MTPEILRQLIRNLPPLPADPEPFTWTHHRQALRDKILTDNPAEFLTWPTVVGTMFVGDNKNTKQKYESVSPAPFYYTEPHNNGYTWEFALTEHPFGNPATLPYHRAYSGNTVSQVYHLLQGSINPAALNSALEIGGGFGAMAAIFHRMGFKGTYTIVDFPEFSALQRYYLSHVAADLNAVFVADSAKWADKQFTLNTKYDLLMGFHSLSEIDDLSLRAMLLNCVKPKTYFIASQSEFMGVDNRDWFTWYSGTKPEYKWEMWDNDCQPGHFYLKGVKK
jgi:hypothetical protein